MSTIDQFRICSSEEIRKKKQEQQNRYEDQEVQSWSKGYELMAIISAGSFAVIASLSQEEPTWVLKTAMILMLLTVVSVVVGFHSHSRYLRLLKRENPISKQVFLASSHPEIPHFRHLPRLRSSRTS